MDNNTSFSGVKLLNSIFSHPVVRITLNRSISRRNFQVKANAPYFFKRMQNAFLRSKYIALDGVLFLSASKQETKFNKLTPEEEQVIVNKGTEMPFTGKYYAFWEKGTYVCKRCGAKLYRSENKFEANCGWPSFDDEIPGAVKRIPDVDGMRTEIECVNCGAHLGHVFTGEQFTDKNTRHCVNSMSMDFIPDQK